MNKFPISYYAFLFVSSVFIFSGCGSSQHEYKPILASVDGQLKTLTEEEAQSVCDQHFCEKNHIYEASFGRRKSSPPSSSLPLNPAPSKPKVPNLVGTFPPNTRETMDYSRNILNMSSAWKVSEGSQNVLVAIIDTGMDLTHPDLKNNLFVNTAELNGKPGIDDDGDGYVDDVYGWDFVNNRPNAVDDNGHGTHCAGIIGAEKNTIGSIGITPQIKILPLKFLSSNGSGDTKDAISAIDYAIKMGANVISMSWGGAGYSQLLDDAIQRARAKGIFVVAAAGNDSSNNDVTPSYPAGIKGVIAVGSSDENDQLSSFSNYGKSSVMLIAPGSNIFSTYLSGTYKLLSGTSMATPQVAGALALSLSLRKDLTPNTILSVLCNSSEKILSGTSQCGRMDVGKFMDSISTLFP